MSSSRLRRSSDHKIKASHISRSPIKAISVSAVSPAAPALPTRLLFSRSSAVSHDILSSTLDLGWPFLADTLLTERQGSLVAGRQVTAGSLEQEAGRDKNLCLATIGPDG